MTTTEAIMFSTNILTGILLIRCFRKLFRVRKQWRNNAARVIEQQGEIEAWKEAKEGWQENAHDAAIENNRLKNKIESLINGDSVCPNGHRYNEGDGYKCPHCSAITKFSQPAEA